VSRCVNISADLHFVIYLRCFVRAWPALFIANWSLFIARRCVTYGKSLPFFRKRVKQLPGFPRRGRHSLTVLSPRLFQMPESLLLPASYIVMAEAEPDLSTFENKTGLAEDMKFLASMPELCDVTFLVGDTREPVCAVKAVLAARSRVFHKMLYQVYQQKITFTKMYLVLWKNFSQFSTRAHLKSRNLKYSSNKYIK
jgi:hypothetical protein